MDRIIDPVPFQVLDFRPPQPREQGKPIGRAMNRVVDLLDRLSPGDEVADRRIQGLSLGVPLHAGGRRVGQGRVLAFGIAPDGVQGLQDLVSGGWATFEEALMSIAAQGRGDVRDPPLSPFQVTFDGMTDKGLPFLRPQRWARHVLVDQFAECRV